MRKIFFTVMLFSVMLLSACNATAEMPEATPTLMPTVVPTQMPVENQNILFEEHQLYAVAYLRYETIEDISYYQENYLEEEDISQYYFSGGEYYLIIPRYGDTNYSSVEVKNGEKDGNGNVKLQYLRREDGKEYIVTLKKHANGYYFVSNCEME